jgi:hypothetical protein
MRRCAALPHACARHVTIRSRTYVREAGPRPSVRPPHPSGRASPPRGVPALATGRTTFYPAVRSHSPLLSTHTEVWSPYRDVNSGFASPRRLGAAHTRVPINDTTLPRTRHAPPPCAMDTSAMSFLFWATTVRVSTPPPPWMTTATSSVARTSPPPPPSPEHVHQWPPDSGAAEPSRRLWSRPVRARKSSLGDPQAVPRPRSAGLGRRFAGIRPEHRRSVPKDPIARGNSFPRVDLQSKGFSVRNQKLSGVCL